MTKIIGRQDSIGIAKETTRGTQAVPTYWVPWIDLDIDDKVEAINDETSLAVLEDSDDSQLVEKWGEITWKTKLKDTHIGLLFLSMFGSLSSAVKGGETIVYEHTYSVLQDTQHETITVGHKNANDDVAYANGLLDSLKITAELGNYVMYEASIQSAESVAAAPALTVAHVQENDFLPQHMTFKEDATQSGLAGASATKIRSLEIEFSQNIFREHVLGNLSPEDILNQQLSVSGSITLIHDGSTFSVFQNTPTTRAMRINLVHTETIGVGSNPEILLDLYKASFTNYSRDRALNDMVEESFDFKAHYSLGDAKMFDLVLTNLTASY